MRRFSLGFLTLLLALIPGLRSASAQEIPAIVALTLDTSGSISPALLDQTRELALGVLQALPPGSQVALFTFDDQSRLILDRSSDPAAVQQALAGVNRAGRYTALYDAIYDASRYLREAPPSRKAIVLITDGLDENSSLQVEDGLKVAVENKIPIYAVGVGKVQEAVLRRVAKLTSGEYLPMAQASGASLAGQVQQLPAPAPPTATPAAAQPQTQPAATAAAPTSDLTWLYAIAALTLVVVGIAIMVVARRQPAVRIPPPAVARPDPEMEDVAEEEGSDEGEERTIVMRSPEVGGVERTVMLRLQPSLTITKGIGEGQVFNLSMEAAISIGRAPTNDIPINDSAVSGEHCRVRPEQGGFVLNDLRSTNGTFVNEKRIERHRLSEGDVIRVGETQLKFKMT